MKNVGSSILVIAGPENRARDLGAESMPLSDEAIDTIYKGQHSVYVLHLPVSPAKEFNRAFRELRDHNHSFELILWGEEVPAELIEGLRIFRRGSEVQGLSYESSIFSALERVQTTKQNQQLLELIHDQNKRLLSLGKTLDERITKRQAYLQKTHSSIIETNRRNEAFQKALIAIHKSNSVGEMETLLAEAIADAFKITWVRMVLGQNQHLHEQFQKDRMNFPIFTVDLNLQGEFLGRINFGRRNQSYNRAEKDLLTQISDSVALALGRLKILRDTEEIKMQWEATFNSITSPLALINENYEVLRSNGAFLKFGKSPKGKCYELLMNRTSPCEGCELGKRFRVDLSGDRGKVTILDVYSQRIPGQKNFVNIYRDISSQLQIETRIMESAKVAELGTIGSSIAHELNNPLSGIITFIQLIKMDLKGQESYFSDINALDEAAQKCREIIQNLLNFSRAPGEDEHEEKLELNTVVRRAIQILELQSRSSEVEIKSDLDDEAFAISANFGMLTQALVTQIQLAIESARAQGIQPIGLKVTSKKTREKMSVQIVSPKVASSSGSALDGPQMLRRTIAERILVELGGSVEYFAEMEGQVAVKISFPVRKLPSEV